MLGAIVCFCLLMFFVNREINRVDRNFNQIVGQYNTIRDHIALLGTHVNVCSTSMTSRLDTVTQKLDMHASAIEKIEWGSTEGDDGDDGDEKDGDEDEGEDEGEDDDDDGSGHDEHEIEDVIGDVIGSDPGSERHEKDGGRQMRNLLAHIDSLRVHQPCDASSGSAPACKITIVEEHETSDDDELLPSDTQGSDKVFVPDIHQVKSILKASHVDCRGNRETLLKKLAALQR